MTTVTLSSTEARHAKALALLAQRGQWLTVRDRHGREFVGIPSQTKHGLVHLVAGDGSQCDCPDFRRGRSCCKHTLARKLDLIARGAAEPMPASHTIDGLRQVLEQRLAESHFTEHTNDHGDVIHLPRATDERITRYDDIFARFED